MGIAALAIAVSGYFFGLSEGKKKEKTSDVKAEVIIGFIAMLVAMVAAVFGT